MKMRIFAFVNFNLNFLLQSLKTPFAAMKSLKRVKSATVVGKRTARSLAAFQCVPIRLQMSLLASKSLK